MSGTFVSEKNDAVSVCFYDLFIPQIDNNILPAVGNDNKRAKKRYLANIRLAQAFHPVISQFEVVLRNCINNN
ncbi:hypothetical protein [Kaistella sp.]|uniref:hypothetical protein n=1 Tax=Kaistella sp. TaxID=2782235 RepID=UPI003C4749E2